ncbi:M3 family metallopeptidase, partial [Escherichia coli]|nr:M3 family metallopeptidase [Escherichia coli]
LDVVSNLFFNLNSAETNDELQKIAQEVSPLLTEFSSKIFQNHRLFLRVKSVYDSKQNLDLNEEQTMLLEQTYKGFVR